MLLEKHSAQLGKLVGRVDQHGEDGFAISGSESDYGLVADNAGFEPLRRVAVAGLSKFEGEAQRGSVSDVDSGYLHRGADVPPRCESQTRGASLFELAMSTA